MRWRRALFQCSLAIICCFVASGRRQDATAEMSHWLKPEAEMAHNTTTRVAFITKEHDWITTRACESLKDRFATDSAGEDRLTKIVPHSVRDALCERMRAGTLWPDCPTYRDSFTLESACIRFPVVGDVPFHEGTRWKIFNQVSYLPNSRSSFQQQEFKI
eukprot:2353493-Amphidinium_carterae.2